MRDAHACKQAGDALAARGRLAEAREQYELAVDLQPENPRLQFQLGACEWRLGRVQAGARFQRAVELDAKFFAAYAALASWQLQHGLFDSADATSQRGMDLAPLDESILHARAAVLEAVGDLDGSWQLVNLLLDRGITSMPVIRLYFRMARYRGDQQRALGLISQRMTDSNLAPLDRARLHFAAAELLDSLNRFDEAFGHAIRANQLARPGYNPATHQRTFDILIEYFTRDRLMKLPRGNDKSGKPVFIVGMPRSGSSLVEQILASHPDVHGCGELDFMSRIWAGTVQMLSALPEQYPGCLDRLTVDQADGMAQIYLEPLIAMNPSAKRLTDKLPLNFLHLGLIAVLLPGARIIDCRRDPRDTCVSCYLAMFEEGNNFKFDLNHTAHFFLQHQRLMAHWDRSLDLPMLRVDYEQLVSDPEPQARRMLAFLDLPWDEKCLRFNEKQRPVATSSVQQVRRPIYQSSIGRWRHYARHLADLDRWFGPPARSEMK